MRAAVVHRDECAGAGPGDELKVMRCLLLRAKQQGTLQVTQSQRQIAVAIDVHQPTVSKVLVRLEERGLLTRQSGAGLTGAGRYDLVPPTRLKELSAEDPPPAGIRTDNAMRVLVHPLFGAGGLGPGPADTFALLSEYSQRLGRHRLVRLRPGTAATGLGNTKAGTRQIPAPARHGRGLPVKQLAALRQRSEPTIRKHLKTLEQVGLVFERDGRWWRVRFNPDAVVDELGVVDTVARKRQEYVRQRRNRFRALSRTSYDGTAASVREEVVDGALTYVCSRTAGRCSGWTPGPSR